MSRGFTLKRVSSFTGHFFQSKSSVISKSCAYTKSTNVVLYDPTMTAKRGFLIQREITALGSRTSFPRSAIPIAHLCLARRTQVGESIDLGLFSITYICLLMYLSGRDADADS